MVLVAPVLRGNSCMVVETYLVAWILPLRKRKLGILVDAFDPCTTNTTLVEHGVVYVELP